MRMYPARRAGYAPLPRVLPLVLLAAFLLLGSLVAGVPLRVHAATATLSAIPASITQGGSVLFTGTGFTPGETITLTLSGQTASLATVTADGSGDLPGTSVVLPATLSPASYTVTAIGGTSGAVAIAAITVTGLAPLLSVNVSSVARGGTVTVSGSGFAPNEPIAITLSGQASPLSTPQADVYGNLLQTNVTLPSIIGAGNYLLIATGQRSGASVSAPLLVTGGLLYLSNSSVSAGSTVIVAGSGFAAGEYITISMSGQSAALASAQADTSGNLAATSITIPSTVPQGSYTLTASGLSSGASATATLVVTTGQAVLSLSSTSVLRGGSVVASGSGFSPNEIVTLDISGEATPLSTIQADGSGNLPATTVTLPSTLPSGSYLVTAAGTSSGRTATTSLILNGAVLSVTPSTVVAGSAVTISGSGFAANEAVIVTISGQSTALTAAQADPTGALPATAVTIPAALVAGSYTLTATGASSASTATATLTVTSAPVPASVSTNPSSVAAGAAVTVSGSGFTAGESVSITLNGQSAALATIQADGYGNLPATSVTIPVATSAGTYTLTATGTGSGKTASTTLTVTALSPVLTLSGSTVERGGTLAASGSGFAAGEVVSLSISGQSGTLATATADSTGTLPATTITIPAGEAAGSYTLSATGATSNATATASFYVNSVVISLSSSSAVAGGTVLVSGSGFAPNEPVAVALSGQGVVLTTVQADGSGAFQATSVSLPSAVAPGTYTLTATGTTSNGSAGAALTVSSPVVAVLLTTATQPVAPGGSLSISGSGFGANESVLVTISGQSALLATLQVGGSGALAATTIVIPSSLAPGSYTVRATGESTGKVASFTVTVRRPAPGVTLSSASVQTGKTVRVRGTNFGTDERITLSFNGVVVRTPSITTGSNGVFSATITVPATALNGANTLTATGSTSHSSARAALTVQTVLSARWYIAGLSTTGTVHPTVALQNTQTQPARVQLTFFYGDGARVTRTVTLAGKRQARVAVASLKLPAGNFGLEVLSDRALNAHAQVASKGHPTITLPGATVLGKTWRVTTGTAAPAQLFVLNLSQKSTAHLQLRLVSGSGHTTSVTLTAPPHSDIDVTIAHLLAATKGALTITASQPLVIALR